MLAGYRITSDDTRSLAVPHPIVSVCIANYNGMEVIDDCIRSIVEQMGSVHIEILIHDDASIDGSANHIKTHYTNVTLIESKDNVGFCVANNRLANIARGDYLLLLNNDATLLPDALSTLLTEAQLLNQPAILSLPQYDASSGELLDIGCWLDPFYNPVPNRDPARNDVGMVMGACLWIDRSLWRNLGGFPQWFGSIGEDMFLCCRARLAGHPVRALGTSGYHHRVGRSFGGGKIKAGKLISTYHRRALSERNKTFVLASTCPHPVVAFLLPLHLTLLLFEGTLLSLLRMDSRYMGKIYLPVFSSLFRHHKDVRAMRALVQKNRLLSNTDFFSAFDRWPYKLRMLIKHGLPALR